MKRILITVTPAAAGWAWAVKGPKSCTTLTTKAAAVGFAARWGRDLWNCGKLAQVRVHRRDGTFHFERTYGKDPRRTPG